jgi:hypothetical protein
MTALNHKSQGNRPSPLRFPHCLVALLGATVCTELSETGKISHRTFVRSREGE